MVKFYTEFSEYEKTTFLLEEVPEIQVCTLLQIKYFPSYPDIETLENTELLRLIVLDAIWYINKLIDATRNCFGLDYLYNITIWDLPSQLIIEMDGDNYLYLTRPQEIMRKDILINQEGIKLIGSTISTSDNYPEYFLVEKFFDTAKSYLYKEQFIDAIIYLQTSFEVYIRSTMKIILKQEGATEEKIQKYNKIPFRNTIESHLGKHLKFNLNFNTPGPINEWYKNLYLLRNEIIHEGRTFLTGDDAYRAYDAYVEARNFLSDKLLEHGYLSKEGKLNLTLFRKNTPDSIDQSEFIERLKTLGLVNPDAKII